MLMPQRRRTRAQNRASYVAEERRQNRKVHEARQATQPALATGSQLDLPTIRRLSSFADIVPNAVTSFSKRVQRSRRGESAYGRPQRRRRSDARRPVHQDGGRDTRRNRAHRLHGAGGRRALQDLAAGLLPTFLRQGRTAARAVRPDHRAVGADLAHRDHRFGQHLRAEVSDRPHQPTTGIHHPRQPQSCLDAV